MIVHYFERIQNVRLTARQFDIKPKQVHDWRSKKQELLNAAPYLLTLNHDRPAQYLLLEEKLIQWIEVLRKKQIAVTQNMVIRRAKMLAKTKDDLVFDYEILDENSTNMNEENNEELVLDNIDAEENEDIGEEYKEIEADNAWE
ncbi:10699_t:CDS:2 [Cetraspora pellucida]|uniref:10699_t:CDS:1 n=1 Tax=Cetraspora pellucida TaxID=1433469 RepID=A0A9N9JPP1_9GLOM|nr:10699_t:CDS:2 [Cetraspora pellucida]